MQVLAVLASQIQGISYHALLATVEKTRNATPVLLGIN
jgi:hypothetical protein